MYRDYQGGMSLAQVATKYGRYRQNVWSLFRSRGFIMRDRIKACVASNSISFFDGMAQATRKKNGCWIWPFSRSPAGYGKIGNRYAHRMSFEAYIGKVPDGLEVCHQCDEPGCVNPDHLFIGTHQDNMRDSASKGRNGNAKLDRALVRYIRKNYKSHDKYFGAIPLGHRFGVHRSTIQRVATGRRYGYVN